MAMGQWCWPDSYEPAAWGGMGTVLERTGRSRTWFEH
jgi:hypothetical protein